MYFFVLFEILSSTVRQKHIRIADCSDLRCAVVEAYMDNELVLDSDDERKLYKANHKVQQTVKRKRADSATTAAKRRASTKSVEPQRRLGNQGTRAPTVVRPDKVWLTMNSFKVCFLQNFMLMPTK